MGFNSPYGRAESGRSIETELAKIERGFGDLFFYGHVEERQVRHWMGVDLGVFRRCKNGPDIKWEEQDNKDGTYFNAYHVLSFPDDILVAASETLKLAMREGISAVEPLPRMPWVSPNLLPYRAAPDLQELIAKYAGYEHISAEAWAKYDNEMADWKAGLASGAYRSMIAK